MKAIQHRLTFIGLSLLALITLQPLVARAHPLGNFSVNYYSRIELSPNLANVFYVMDWAEIPTFQLKQKIDTSGDGQVDANELDAYKKQRVEELRGGVKLVVDGKPVALSIREPNATFSPGQGGLDTLRLTMWLDGVLPSVGANRLDVEYVDTNDTARLGWREIVLLPKDGMSVSDVGGAHDKDVSNELRNYPEDLLSSPLKQTDAKFKLGAGAGQTSGATTTGETKRVFGSGSRDAQFSALINADLTPVTIATTILGALVLGALHALEPGHGKSVAAAYLVGTRATPRHAFLLGATITITHTISVFLLGFITLVASTFIVPEKLFPYLGLLSAAIVIVMGINMIVNAIRNARALSEDAAHASSEGGAAMHSHGGKLHKHVPPTKMNAKNVLAVGVSGGLVPCPAALVVLLSSIALGRVGFGMALIVVFSVGLAAILTIISLIVLYGKKAVSRNEIAKRIADRLPSSGRAAALLPAMSGALVLIAGFYLLYLALPFLQLF
jgi:ABC-type nickel/cobalt efflux system permease component RcnA